MKKINQYLVSLCLLLVISACSTLPEESITNVEWEQHSEKLSDIHSFKATGKIGYRSPSETISLNFYWKHTPEQSELRLINFLGSTVLTLTMTPDGSKVVTSDDKVFEDNNTDALLARLTGLVFPVSHLKYWIKGQPIEADSYSFNETNTLQRLQKTTDNRTWTLDYTRYQDYEELPLPYQMTLNSDDTRIKIIVSKWEINS